MVTITAIASAATMEAQIPFTFQNIGKINTAATWNTNVLIKEIAAETSPSFSTDLSKYISTKAGFSQP